jgi:hypothetical protein
MLCSALHTPSRESASGADGRLCGRKDAHRRGFEAGASLTAGCAPHDTGSERVLESTLIRPSHEGKMTPAK